MNIVKMPLSDLTARVMRGELADSKTIIGALMAQKLLKAENVPAMAEVFLKYVKTDLTLGNLVWLGNEALNMGGMDAVSFHTLPGDGTGFYKGASVYVLDADAMLELVNSALNPYAEDISAEDMDILVP